MKYLIAIIEQERLREVVRGIETLLLGGGPKRLTVSEVSCYGHEDTLPPIYRGYQQPESPLPKVKLEVLLDEEQLQPVVDAIAPGTDALRARDKGIVILDLA